MVQKWFLHRRLERTRTAQPLGKQSFSQQGDGGGTKDGQSVKIPRIRTEVVYSGIGRQRKQKTIITIRGPSGGSAGTSGNAVKAGSTCPQYQHPPPESKSTEMDETAVELNEESFGIESPSSPASTLRYASKTIGSFDSSNPTMTSFISDRSSLKSLDTVATVVDDGLSPWGLPKALDPSHEEDLGETYFESEQLDLENEMLHIDHTSHHDIAVADYAQVLNKLRTLSFAIKLVVLHRVRSARQKRSQLLRDSKVQAFPTFGLWV